MNNAKTGEIRATKPFLPMNLYNIYKHIQKLKVQLSYKSYSIQKEIFFK